VVDLGAVLTGSEEEAFGGKRFANALGDTLADPIEVGLLGVVEQGEDDGGVGGERLNGEAEKGGAKDESVHCL
jgi:hypothetical protein